MSVPILHVNAPFVADRPGFLRRVDEILSRNRLTNNGPEVLELEARASAYFDVEHTVAVSSATVGMELLLRALALSGEVVLPAFTFVSTAGALVQRGLRPVFCDVDAESGNADASDIAGLVGANTSAIIATHLWGKVADVVSLQRIADQNDIPLIFDAAHAFGSVQDGVRAGSFGLAEVFSLHATKSVQGFEGGLIATNDSALADQIRVLRNFGFEGYDDVRAIGGNGKLSEIHAAMANSNLQHIDLVVERSRAVHRAYQAELDRLPGFDLLATSPEPGTPQHYVVVRVNEGRSRDEVVEHLHEDGILARRYFYPGTHRIPVFAEYSHRSLPRTDELCRRLLVLPGGASLEPVEARRVCDSLSRYAGAPAASSRVRSSRTPKVEFRVPISPNEQFLRMSQYLVASLREQAGGIAADADIVFSVSAECEPFPLELKYPWIRDWGVDYRWVDPELFSQMRYEATGYDRYLVESEADIVVMADADILAAGSLDRPITKAHLTQTTLGAIAHVSPFESLAGESECSESIWRRVFAEAGVEAPTRRYEHTAWGLVTENPLHRYCPIYYNYGFVISPREHVEKMASTFLEDLDAVNRAVSTWACSQVAFSVSLLRHGLEAESLEEIYNFPLHMPSTAFHRLNSAAGAKVAPADIRLFHYLGHGEINKDHFVSVQALKELRCRPYFSPYAKAFMEKLDALDETLEETQFQIA